MHEVLSRAYVVHRTAGRIRVRIPGRRLDHAYFERLKQRLVGSPGVTAVEINPLTAGVLVEHSNDFKPASFGAVGIVFASDGHGASGLNNNSHRGAPRAARTQRDDGTDMLWALAKLAYAAMTGQLWNHLLEQIVGWCAQRLIDALRQPKQATAQVIRLARPRSSRQQPALAAAA